MSEGVVYEVTIPDYWPPSLNRCRGRHWSAERWLKRECVELVGAYARLAGVPLATGPRRVSLVLILGPRQRRRMDPDNAWKVLLDVLVRLQLLRDDGPAWCILGPVTFESGLERAMRIVLEDLEHG